MRASTQSGRSSRGPAKFRFCARQKHTLLFPEASSSESLGMWPKANREGLAPEDVACKTPAVVVGLPQR
jgi:hypothetical protein